MKFRALFATFILWAAASSSAPAQTLDPCTVFTCMAGMPGVVGLPGGPLCTPSLLYWHAASPAGLAVYVPYEGFDSTLSATLRRTYLSTCPGVIGSSNAAILELILSEYGYLP